MNSIREDFETFRRQLEKGPVKRAYRGLLAYMLGLRNHFKNGDPGYAVSGLYQGYMDMTYFALFPPKLKSRDLKIAIVFNYEAFRFEVWLSGKNQAVQRQYWELLKQGRWDGYRLVAPAKGVDSIIERDLVEDFDLGDPDALTSRIETDTAAFIDEVERFLAERQPGEETER